ncbi:hypothetical protein [Phormidesmis priestleyi]
MKRIRRITAIALVGFLAFSAAKPVKSNPALVAPAACATGVGCILVGVAVVGGVVYYVWQNRNERRHYLPIEDPEKEAQEMGGPHDVEPVIAGKASDAKRKCQQLARGRKLKEVRWFQGNRWDCVFY